MKLAEADILRLLPDHISGDPQFAATGQAANPVLAKIARAIPNLLLWARLGKQDPETFLPPLCRLTNARPGLAPLDLDTLESLAWQFHVDFREVARTNEQIAEMVLHSIDWHRIKGTPASIKKALSLFNFGGIYIDEHDPGMHWATYQLGFDEIASLEDLALILKICNEMQPARCRLWRVYTSDFDFRPGVWSGQMPKHAWSSCWWSSYSGNYFPELPGLDDRGLLVSFGLTKKYLCEPWQPHDLCVGLAISACMSLGWPLLSYPIWSVAHWSDPFPLPVPASFTQISPFHGCELFYDPALSWVDAPWLEKPWARLSYWDRKRQPFTIWPTAIPFSQECWSDNPHKGNRYPYRYPNWAAEPWHEDDWGVPQRRSGGWSAENSFWGTREILITANAPEWGNFHWSDEHPEPFYQRIDEFFYEFLACATNRILPEKPPVFAGFPQLRAFQISGWPNSPWLAEPWKENIGTLATQILGSRSHSFFASAWPYETWPEKGWVGLDHSFALGQTQLFPNLCEEIGPGDPGFCASECAAWQCAFAPGWNDLSWPPKSWTAERRLHRPGEHIGTIFTTETLEEAWEQ